MLCPLSITQLAPYQLKVHEAFMTPIDDICTSEVDLLNDIKDSLIEEVLGKIFLLVSYL